MPKPQFKEIYDACVIFLRNAQSSEFTLNSKARTLLLSAGRPYLLLQELNKEGLDNLVIVFLTKVLETEGFSLEKDFNLDLYNQLFVVALRKDCPKVAQTLREAGAKFNSAVMAANLKTKKFIPKVIAFIEKNSDKKAIEELATLGDRKAKKAVADFVGEHSSAEIKRLFVEQEKLAQEKVTKALINTFELVDETPKAKAQTHEEGAASISNASNSDNSDSDSDIPDMEDFDVKDNLESPPHSPRN